MNEAHTRAASHEPDPIHGGACLDKSAAGSRKLRAGGRCSQPLVLYVVADAHIGKCDRGDKMRAFAGICNSNNPDVVIDLGDAIHGSTSDLYDSATALQAALEQHQNWKTVWDGIDAANKTISLGNRDLKKTGMQGLMEAYWARALGYEHKSDTETPDFKTSLIASNGCVEVLVISTCMYAENFSMPETIDWAGREAARFAGDFIIFANHNVSLYKNFRKLLIDRKINTPAIFLHGHNHGPDTLVRDAWGYEANSLDFPCYLVADLMSSGIAAGFLLYKNGSHETLRLDVRNKLISKPLIHYKTRT